MIRHFLIGTVAGIAFGVGATVFVFELQRATATSEAALEHRGCP